MCEQKVFCGISWKCALKAKLKPDQKQNPSYRTSVPARFKSSKGSIVLQEIAVWTHVICEDLLAVTLEAVRSESVFFLFCFFPLMLI